MKVAITAQGKTPSDHIDSRFGRAQQFILMDTESEDYEVLDNTQNLNAAQGAGIQAAQHIVNAGADAVITGHCGLQTSKFMSVPVVPSKKFLPHSKTVN